MDFLMRVVRKLGGGGDEPRHFEAEVNKTTPILFPARATLHNECATIVTINDDAINSASNNNNDGTMMSGAPLITAAPHAATHVLCMDVDESLSLVAVAVATDVLTAETGSPLSCHHTPRQKQQLQQQQQQKVGPGSVDVAVYHLQNPSAVQWLLADSTTALFRSVSDVRFLASTGFVGVLADRHFHLFKIGASPSEPAFLHLSVRGQLCTAMTSPALPCPSLPSMFVGSAAGNVLCARVSKENVSSVTDIALLSRSMTRPFFDTHFAVSHLVHCPANADLLLVAYCCSADGLLREAGRVASACLLWSISRGQPMAIIALSNASNNNGAGGGGGARSSILVNSLTFDTHWSPSADKSVSDIGAPSILGITSAGAIVLWKNDAVFACSGATLPSQPSVVVPITQHQLFGGSESITAIRLRPATLLPRQVGVPAGSPNFPVHLLLVEHSIVRPAAPANSVYNGGHGGHASSAVSCVAVRVNGNQTLTVATAQSGHDITTALQSSSWPVAFAAAVARNEFAATPSAGNNGNNNKSGCTARKSPVAEFWQASCVPPPANRPWLFTLFGGGEARDTAVMSNQAALDVHGELTFDKKSASLHLVLGVPVGRVAPCTAPPLRTVFPAAPLLQLDSANRAAAAPCLPPTMILTTVSIPDGGALDGGAPEALRSSLPGVVVSSRLRQDSLIVVSARPSERRESVGATGGGAAVIDSLQICRWSPSLDAVLGSVALVPLSHLADSGDGAVSFDSRTVAAEIVCVSCNGRKLFAHGIDNGDDDENNDSSLRGGDSDDDDHDGSSAFRRGPQPLVNSFLLLLRGRHKSTSQLALFGMHVQFESDWRGWRCGSVRCLSTRPRRQVGAAAPVPASSRTEEERRLAAKNAAVPMPVEAPAAAAATVADAEVEVIDCASFRVWTRPAILTRVPATASSSTSSAPARVAACVAMRTHLGSLLSLDIELPLTETSDITTRPIVPEGTMVVRAVSNIFMYPKPQPQHASAAPPTQPQRVAALMLADSRIVVIHLASGRILHTLALAPIFAAMFPHLQQQQQQQQQSAPLPFLPQRIDVVADSAATVEFAPCGSLPQIFSFELFLPAEKQQASALISSVRLGELHVDPERPVNDPTSPPAAGAGAGGATSTRLIARVSSSACSCAPYDILVTARGPNVVVSLLTPSLLTVKGRLLLPLAPAAAENVSAVAVAAQTAVFLGARELHLLLALSAPASAAESHLRIVFQEVQDGSNVAAATLVRLDQLADCCAFAFAMPMLPDTFASGQSRGAVRFGVPKAAALSTTTSSESSASHNRLAAAQLPVLPFEESGGATSGQQKGSFLSSLSKMFSSTVKLSVPARNENVLQFIHLRAGNWAATKAQPSSVGGMDDSDFDGFLRHVAMTTDNADARQRLMSSVGPARGASGAGTGGTTRGGRVGAAGGAASQAQVDMAEAVQRLRERGDQIDRVADRSQRLADAASQYEENARKLRERKSSWF